jgi:AcrR family transcriptional regulator
MGVGTVDDNRRTTMATTLTPTTRSSWIEAGLRALGDGGPEAVRVEPLARSLGLTKGSFYWHFEDRQALLDELLDSWERRMIDEVIERVEREGGDARLRLRRLFSIASSKETRTLARSELAIRDWARHDERVSERLERVDDRRMDYMRRQFAEFCLGEEDVEARSMLAFSLFIGAGFIHADPGARGRAGVIELAVKYLGV